MRLLPSFLIAVSLASAAPLRIAVDRPGQWEFEWRSGGWRTDTATDGSIGFRAQGLANSEEPGDLAAPRLKAIVALPETGGWNVEILTDSVTSLAGASWRRIAGFDPRTGRSVAVPPVERQAWSAVRMGSFRLLRMDLPLVVPVAGGVQRREHLRVRLTWEGGARLPVGSPWAKAVDNPNGIRITSAAAARRAASAADAVFAGTLLDVAVGDDDPFTSAEDGVVRLTGAALYKASGVLPGTVSFANVAVYAGLSDTAPVQSGAVGRAPALRAIPLERIDRDGDGVLGADDEIRFWGRGTNVWKRVEGSPLGWRYAINPYTKTRNYLVRLDAPTGSPQLGAATKGTGNLLRRTVAQPAWIGRPDKVKEAVIGKSGEFDAESGKDWYWRSSDNGSPLLLPDSGLSLPGRATDSVLARVEVARSSWYFNGVDALAGFGIAGNPGWDMVDSSLRVWAGTDIGASRKGFELPIFSNSLAVSGVDFSYQRDLSTTDSAVFPAPGAGAWAIPVPGGKECWVLEDGVAVRKCAIESGRLLDSATTPGTWYAFFPKDPRGIPLKTASRAVAAQSHVVKDYYASNIAANVLVVAPMVLAAQAEAYAIHREGSFQVRPQRTAIVRTEDLYDLWSGGKMDPAAIRDAIRWAHERWGTSHVLLLGAGHFDPRKVTGAAPNVLIPQWEDGPVATDLFYSFLLPSDQDSTQSQALVPVVAVGRVPAYTAGEFDNWFAKLVSLENPAKGTYGPWRNTVVFAADDVRQIALPDPIPDHTNQSEAVAQAVDAVRPWLRQEKLFLLDYPANVLYQKPEAARDLSALLNRGTVGFNYIGHGGEYMLADESLLAFNGVDRTLTNKTSPFLFFAGSCSVGRNDMNLSRGLAEHLVVVADKGAFAAFSGTRPTFPKGNGELSRLFWQKLSDPTGVPTIGEAILAATGFNDDALSGSSYSNRHAYNLLGDPASIVFPGGLPVAIAGIPDTIQALSKVAVRGASKGGQGFQSRLEVEATPDSALAPNGAFQVYRAAPVQIVSLQGVAAADSFRTSLPIPARIAFGDSATLRVYAWSTSARADGGQVLAPRRLFGTSSDVKTETQGPDISLRPCDSSWSGGVAFSATARIPRDFCIEVDLQDSSGISSEQGPDEGVVFSLPGVKEAWHPVLRQVSDYRHATAQLVTDSSLFVPGKTYTFDVLARDLMGNRSEARLQIEVLAKTDYSLYDVFNSPNPVRDGENTAFYFKLSATADSVGMVDSRIQSSIRIHTASGKLVRVLRTELATTAQPRPRAVWDLRDSFGNPVANGLYPYTVILRFPDRSGVQRTEITRKGIVAVSR